MSMIKEKLLNTLKVNFNTVKYLFQFSKKCRISYIIALIINSFSMIRYSFVIGFPIKWVTDSLFEQDWERLKINLIITAIILAVNGALTFLEGYLMLSSTAKVSGAIRKKLLSHILFLPSKFFDKNHSADLICRVTDNVEDTEKAISFDLVETINFLSLGVGSLVFIAFMSIELALICTGLSLLVILLNIYFLKPIKEASSKVKKSLALSSSRYSDLINGLPVIKMFNLQNWIIDKCNVENENIKKWVQKLGIIEALQKGSNEFLFYIFSIGAIGIGALFLFAGKITPGSLLALKRYTSVLVFAFIGAGESLAAITRLLEGAHRVIDVLEIEPEKITPISAGSTGKPSDDVLSFSNLSFGYVKDKNIIYNFSCSIKAAEKVALFGASGAGKSTLIRLIHGLYTHEPAQGKIKLFDKDINDYSLSERRSYMTYVPQQSHLFMGTIKENIVCGQQDYQLENIIRAAERANAHDFIMKLPDGYDTVVNEEGKNFSGGEKQRIAIARAFYRHTPILLLDEPTASLDSDSEDEIKYSIETLMQGKTVLIISHKLSTINNCDRVILFENGKISFYTPDIFRKKMSDGTCAETEMK